MVSGSESPIDAHLATLPQPQRDTLTALREMLRDLLPDAAECTSYNMPCFKIDGIAVAGFDGFQQHCSYFPHSGNIVSQVSGVPSWCTVATRAHCSFPSIVRHRRRSCASSSGHASPKSKLAEHRSKAADATDARGGGGTRAPTTPRPMILRAERGLSIHDRADCTATRDWSVRWAS